jgi:DNA-binding MarR family transcriptional regulator
MIPSDPTAPKSYDPAEVVVQLRGLLHEGQHFLAWQAERAGLGPLDFLALTRLVATGGLTGVQLGEALGVARSSITGLADRLHRVGLILRRADPQDRRVVVLVASKKGLALVDRAVGPLVGSLADLAENLDAEERLTVGRFLESVATMLAESTNDVPRRSIAPRLRPRQGSARPTRPRI